MTEYTGPAPKIPNQDSTPAEWGVYLEYQRTLAAFAGVTAQAEQTASNLALARAIALASGVTMPPEPEPAPAPAPTPAPSPAVDAALAHISAALAKVIALKNISTPDNPTFPLIIMDLEQAKAALA
jgi:hypothetical protein